MTAPESPQARTVVLGVGNLLMSDEGAGLKAVERLVTTYQLPEEVLPLDGGTLGLDLLYYLEGVENLILVDAVEARKEPGEVVRLTGDEVPSFLSLKMSPHQIGISDMLFAAKLKDIYPSNVVMWGIQPELIEIGLDLSPVVASKMDFIAAQLAEQLRAWGHAVTLKT